MRDWDKRTFGRRDFVRLGAAAGGLSLLAACGPTAAPPAPNAAARSAEAPKPTAAPRAAATGQVTTLILLGWNYEPPLVQENLDRFERQNPTYKVEYEPIGGVTWWTC